MELFVLIWIACGVAALVIASNKGRSGCGWGVLGFLFGPLGLLAAAVISPDRDELERKSVRSGLQSGTMRPCPRCAEPIKTAAILCRFCGSEFPPLPPRRSFLEDVAESIAERKKK